jgi:protein-L-isoaspartate(D-aspartate) O-methyltransferase
MVIPVGNPFQTQILMLVTKGGRGPHDLQVRNLMPVSFVPLVGGAESALRSTGSRPKLH